MKKKENLLQLKRKKFIELMIPATTVEQQIAVYRLIYPGAKNDEGARTSVYKLLQNPNISEAIAEGRRQIEEEVAKAKREERIRIAREQVAHEIELDGKMSEIALGKYSRTKKVVVFNRDTKEFEIKEVEETPSETDMIAAADKLYKRKGSYAINKVEHSFDNTFMDFLKQSSTDGEEGNL